MSTWCIGTERRGMLVIFAGMPAAAVGQEDVSGVTVGVISPDSHAAISSRVTA